MVDPRPDLVEDSRLWTMLLALANQRDKVTAGILHGFRCGGLRISKKPQGYILQPMLGRPDLCHWKTAEEYAKDRQEWLWPCTGMIISLLDQLDQTVNEAV